MAGIARVPGSTSLFYIGGLYTPECVSLYTISVIALALLISCSHKLLGDEYLLVARFRCWVYRPNSLYIYLLVYMVRLNLTLYRRSSENSNRELLLLI